jgi:adenosylhomocysteine nucleosidase
MRIAIIAALPGELKQLVKSGWRNAPTTHRHAKKWTTTFGEDQGIAVCAGMGGDSARRAFAEAERDGAIDMVLSIGWAGALIEGVCAGKCYIPSAVIDAQTGERFQLAAGKRKLILVSTAHVAQEPEKRRLAETYGAAMVDMESAAVVRMAQMRSIPVCCIKGISDDVGDPLPDFNPFIGTDGQMRMGAFLGHVATRPRHWSSLARLGRTSSAASNALDSTIRKVLVGSKNFEDINRTGSVG